MLKDKYNLIKKGTCIARNLKLEEKSISRTKINQNTTNNLEGQICNSAKNYWRKSWKTISRLASLLCSSRFVLSEFPNGGPCLFPPTMSKFILLLSLSLIYIGENPPWMKDGHLPRLIFGGNFLFQSKKVNLI